MKKFVYPLAIAALLGLLGWGLLRCSGTSPEGETGAGSRVRPNLVLISIDTLRSDHVGCYGYSRPTTPVIDEFASKGVQFSNAFAAASWTVPSHMSMLTSTYPHVHGVEDHRSKLHPRIPTLAETLSRGGYHTAGFISWFYLSARLGFGRGFDQYEELLHGETPPGYVVAEDVIDAVLQWLDRNERTPFFLFVHLFDPHMNYQPPAPYDTMFDGDYDGTIDGSRESLMPHIKTIHRPANPIPPRDLEHVIALYDGSIRYADTHLGRLLEALEAKGDDTAIVVTSDHGEEFFERDSMEGHGWTLYDEETHVPLIMKLPGGPSGSKIDTLVESIDIAPTLLDLARLSIPETFRGRSLMPLIRGEESSHDRVTFSEIKRFNFRWAVRNERYKLIYTSGEDPFEREREPLYEFYVLDLDPEERDNVFTKVARSSVALDLLDALMQSFRAAPPPGGEPAEGDVEYTEEELESLRALGYVR